MILYMRSVPYYEPTISDEILSFLLSAGSMRRQKRILWDIIQEKRGAMARGRYDSAVQRLKKKGYIASDGSYYVLTKPSRAREDLLFTFLDEKVIGSDTYIVIFDIPEKKRKVRDWIRGQLSLWDYTMLQKSVWIGKGEFPASWKKRAEAFGVRKNIKRMRVVGAQTKNN